MLNKPWGTTKGISIFITFIGSLSKVDFVILGQECAVTKGLPTLMALIGFLSSVDVWMCGCWVKSVLSLKAFPSPSPWGASRTTRNIFALIGHLSSVTPQGLGEGGVLDKSFLTGVALIVLICLQVVNKRRTPSKCFLTLITLVQLLSSVNLKVLSLVYALAEGFPPSLHRKVFSPVWAAWWWMRDELWLKAFSHSLHWKGFSPGWDLWCFVRDELWLKVLPHSWHLKGFLQCEFPDAGTVTKGLPTFTTLPRFLFHAEALLINQF